MITGACTDEVSEADPIDAASTGGTSSADPSAGTTAGTTSNDTSGAVDGSTAGEQGTIADSSGSGSGAGSSDEAGAGESGGETSSDAGDSSSSTSRDGEGSTSGDVESSGGITVPTTGDDESSSSGATTTTTGDDEGTSSSGDDTSGSSGDATSGESSTDGGESTTDGGDDDGGEPLPPGVLYREDFDGNDGDPWPAPWTIVGDNVLSATIQGGRGQLAGVTDGTARLVLPGFDELDIEMSASVEFSDWSLQGFGMYVRQNGGALDQTEPPGEGYCLFFEGFYLESLGFWREVLGVETLIDADEDPLPGGVVPGVVYRMRFQVEQVHPTYSAMRGKLWPAAEPEPDAWTFSILDDTASMQNVAGSFAVDVYNDAGTESIWIDDIEIRAL